MAKNGKPKISIQVGSESKVREFAQSMDCANQMGADIRIEQNKIVRNGRVVGYVAFAFAKLPSLKVTMEAKKRILENLAKGSDKESKAIRRLIGEAGDFSLQASSYKGKSSGRKSSRKKSQKRKSQQKRKPQKRAAAKKSQKRRKKKTAAKKASRKRKKTQKRKSQKRSQKKRKSSKKRKKTQKKRVQQNRKAAKRKKSQKSQKRKVSAQKKRKKSRKQQKRKQSKRKQSKRKQSKRKQSKRKQRKQSKRKKSSSRKKKALVCIPGEGNRRVAGRRRRKASSGLTPSVRSRGSIGGQIPAMEGTTAGRTPSIRQSLGRFGIL